MRFGLRLIGYLGSVPELVRLAKLGEEAGFDSVWFPHDTFMHNTWVITSAVATATERIAIGSVGTNPYTTDPSEIATYVLSLDELSGGRCILGLGLHTLDMVQWMGIDAGNYLQRTREATDIIRGLLRGETVAYQGQEFRWTDQCYLRFPAYRREVPIYISAFGPDYLRLAGEIGDGCLPMATPPESAAYMISNIQEGLAAAGRRTEDFVISACAWLSLSETAQAAADVMTKMVAYFGPYLEEPALQTIGLSHSDMVPLKEKIDAGRYQEAYDRVTDDMLRVGIVGDPQAVIKRIEALTAEGVTEINLGGPLGPDPEAAISLMGETVIPYFR